MTKAMMSIRVHPLTMSISYFMNKVEGLHALLYMNISLC